MNLKEISFKIIKFLIIIITISLLIEFFIFGYNFFINKIYKKIHFIGNNSIVINMEEVEVEERDNLYYLNVNGIESSPIYNVALQLKDKNKDVYMRLIIKNDSKLIPKENSDGTKFKVYYINGIETNNFSIVFDKESIKLDNIEKIIVNDNLDYMPKIEFSTVQTLIAFLVLTIISITIKLYKYTKENEIRIKQEFIFVVLSSIIGIAFVFINAPQVRYDEHAHFWRAYEISNGNFISRTTNELPDSIIDVFRKDDGSYPNREINYQTIKSKLKMELNQDNKQAFPVGATGSLTPISYIPQVIGVLIGKLLNLNPIIILWLGRLTNLFSYVVLIYIAIKIMPINKLKTIIMIIALFPMSLNLAATLSPDAIIISTAMLAISYAFYLKFEKEKIRLKSITILSILCMIPTLCKIVYFPLTLLVLIIPKQKFENRGKQFLSYLTIILIVFIPYFILNKVVAMGDYAIAIRTNMMEQCIFTFSDLIRDLQVFINTFYSEFSKWIFEAIGGWNTINIISVILLGLLLFVTFLKDEDNDKYTFTKKDKIIFTIIIFIEILGIVAAMYLGWTQAKQMVVEGVQGRYFLPLILLLCTAISGNKIECKIQNKEIKYLITVFILYLIIFGYSIQSYIN